MAGPWESFKPQAAPPAPVENGPWSQFTANAAPELNPPAPEPGLLGRAWNTAAGIGQGLYDLPTYAAGTAANLAEGSRPLDAETWADPASGKSERRQQERLQAPEAQGATLIPGVSRGDINQAFASLPFSVASLGGTLAGGLAGTLTPVPGGAVAGGFAGGLYPAYRADTGMFVRQGLDSFTQKYQEQHGRPPSRDELLQEQERLQPYAREHGLWEAVPEAAGNLVMAPLVKGLLKPGGNLAAKTAKFLAGTTAEELPTETVTQMGQQGVESRAGMNGEAPREFSDPGAWWQSLKEVAPVTVTQSLLMGGAGAGTRFALDRLAARGRAENPAPAAGSETRAPGGLPGFEHPADAFKAAEAAPASGQPAVDSSAASTVPTGIDPATGEVLQGAVSEFSGGLTPANLGQRLPTLAVTAPTDYEETVRKISALPDGHPLKTALTNHQQAVKQKTQQRQAEQAPIAASIAPLPAAETAEQQRVLKRLEQDRNAAVQRARHFERQARAAEESGDAATALARRQQAGQVRDEFAAKVAGLYGAPASEPTPAPTGLDPVVLERQMRERARAANRPAAGGATQEPPARVGAPGSVVGGAHPTVAPQPNEGEAVSAARPAGALAPDSSVNQPENNDGERQGQGRGRQEVLTPSAGIAPPAEPLSARQQPAAEQPSRNPLPFAPTHVLSDGTPVVPNVDERGKAIPNEWLDRDGGIIEDEYAAPIESAGEKGNAQQEQAPGAADGRGGARQGVRGQGGDSAESGAGVQPGGPEGRNPEGQAQGREVTPAPEELRALKTAPPLLSLDKREDSGWRYYESDNAVRLVSRDGKVAREFLNPDTRSGTEMARTRARAHAFALDNPYAGDQGPAPSSENVDPKQTDETVDLPRAPAGAETPAKAAGIAGGLPPDAIPAGVPAAAGSEGGAAGQAAIDAAAQQAATSPVNDKPQPTEAQKKAGNYAKGHIRLHGLDISIENPRGSERSGTDRGGKPWKVRMRHHYGYIKGTVGKDKDHLDVFIGPTPNSPKVYVVDQVDPDTGRFDEHKVLLGFKGLGQAKAGYLGNYAPGWQGLGTITPTSLNEFKTWLTSGNTRQPFAKTQGATDAEHTQRDAAADDRGAEADHPGPGGGEQPPVAAGGGAGSGPGFSDRPGTGSGSDRISGDRETGPDREPEGAAVGGGALGGKADVGVAAAAPPAGKVAADGKPAEAETPKNDDRIEIEGWLDRFRKGNYDFPTMASYQNKKLQDAAEKRLKETRDLYYRAAHEFLEGPLDTPVSGEFGQAKHKVSRLAWGDLEGVHPQPVPKRVGKIRQDLTALRKALMDVHVPKYDVRHYLMGIHMEPENRRMVASNGHTLAVLDNVDLSGLPARPGAETVLNAKDQWVEGKYPDYRKFMPNLRSDDYRTVSAEQIGDYARGIAKANGYLSAREMVPMGFVAGRVRGTYNPVYVAEALDLLRKLGYTEARIAIGDKAQLGSLAIESPDGRLRQLVMPQNFAQGVFDPVDLDAAEPTRKRARAVQAEPEADRVAFDVDGVKVYPGEFRGEPRWFAQFEGNVGTEKTNGDTIHRSREEAESAARRTAEDIKRKQDIAAKDQEVEAERERKKEENRGKSITERRADALLDSPSRFPASVGLGRGTKREAMQSAVDQGRAITAEHVFDSAAKKKDQETVERARRGGYILGLSNENIPEVKAGLEARDRLKADSYQKLEYRVYEGRKPEGGHYVITKTEYDYAKRLQKENEAETRDEPSKPEEKQGESAAIKGAASTQTEYSAKDEVLENRDPPEVAQPTVVGAATIVVKTLSGPKNIRVKLYELPGYKGPQLAVSHTKLRGKDRFAVYLPKSGVLLEDSNGLSTLEETLKNAVQRVSGARKRAADLEREAKIKTENFDERAARLKEEWTRLAEESKNGLSEIAKTEENVKQPEPEKAPPADPVKSAEEKERAAWHTPIPTEGLEIDPKEQKPSGYELVAPRLAADAHAAITQAQHQAIAASGGQWYLYALPAADGRNGIARLFPDDQTPPAPWRLANNGVGIRLNALTKEQAIAAIVQGLKNAPVIGTPASAPQTKRIAGGAPVEGKPDLGRYVQPKGDGSAQQQRDMASRAGRIAPLIMMNDIVGAYDRDALDQIADDRIDPVREYLRQRYNAAKSSEGQTYAEKPVASEQEGAVAKEKPQGAATGDVGDELSHNRRSRGGKITWGDVEKLNPTLRVKEVTKSKVWPKPDYAELAGDGSDKARQVVAHIVKQVYDSIAAGPVVRTAGEISDEALKQYLDGVSRVMGGVLAWAEDKKAVADWFKVVGARAGAMRGLGASLNLSEMTQASRALMERIYPNRSWQNVDREELRRIGGNKVLAALQPGTDEAIKALKDIEKGWPGKRESWQMQGLEVVPIANAEVKRSGVNRPGMEWLVDLGRRNYVSGLTRNYGSEQEAREKLAEYKPFLLFGKRGFAGDFATEDEAVNRARALAKGRRNSEAGPSEKGTSVMASERVGVERRQPGEDVTSDQLKKTFGFRGINFGNWMKGDANAVERQAHLNHAYDAFMDLAEVLKVPPEALSLDGMLGLAIGAQGSGGWAAAHFVPGVNEINLTREGGAGALAHEFGHALDHYFGVMAGLGATKQPWASELNGLLPSQQPKESGLRPELRRLWKALSETITHRVESPEDMRARLEQSMVRGRKTLDQYGAKNKIDAGLLDRLKAGELGDGYVKLDPKSRKRYAETVPANAYEATRQLLGPREGKSAGDQFEWDRTVKAIGMAAMGIDSSRNQLTNNLGKGRMLHTRYYQDAVKTQNDTKMKQGGRDYWTQPTEMLARAFETYVQDRLADAGISNTYLVRAGKAQETEETSVYPRGPDRQAINEAFDRLIGEVKTREGDGGRPVMYSRSPATKAAYESRIDDLFAGAKPEKENGVRVLDRSDLLDLLGYGDHEVVLAEQHAVGEGMFNHGLTASDWKKVPEWLDDPVAAFVRNKDGHVTVIAKETKNGVPIVIGLKPQVGVPGRSGKKLHVVLTAYDKSSGKLPLRRMIDEGELAYLNQKATPLFNRGSGHHLPGNVGELRGYKRKIYTERDLVKYRKSHENQSFSRGLEGGGSTREAVRAELRKAFGKAFEALEKAGLIRIVERQEELPAEKRSGGAMVRGFFDGKRSWLVAEHIPAGGAVGTLLHESGVHQFLPELIGSDRFASLGQEFRRLLKSGDKTAQAVDAHVRGLLDRGEMDPAHADEERIAYAVEMESRQGAAGMSGRFRMWLGRIKAALRAWFWRSGLGRALAAKGFKLNLTVADLAALARAAVREGARNHVEDMRDMVGVKKEQPSPPAPLPEGEGLKAALAQFSKEFGASPEQLRKEFEAVVKRTVGSMAEYDALPAAPGKNGLKAPNGKPSRLNKQQWVMVRTPRFKAWFGDWESAPGKASKVVDANGEPLVVYHGTRADIGAFDNAKGKRKTDAPLFASFASSSPKNASSYAKGKGGNVMPVFMRSLNPLEAKAGASYAQFQSPIAGIVFDVRYGTERHVGVGDYVDINTLAILANQVGHDGMIVRDVMDMGGRKGEFADTYAVFNPTQIKSATGNTGAFDASSPGIRHSLTDRLEQARMLGFDTSTRWYHGTPSGNDFRGFDLEKTGQKTGTREEAVYLTDNPDVAGAYAYQEDIFFEPGGGARTEESYGALLPVYTRGRIYDASGEVPKGRYDADLFERLIDTAKEAGYDGIDFGTIRDVPFGTPYGNPEGRIRAMFYPENIRSTHAEFDPGKRQLNDLLFSQGALPGASEAGRAAREFGQSLPGLAKLGRDFKRQFHKLGDSAKTLVLGGLTARMNAELARGVLPMIEQRFLPAMQNQEAVSGQLREYFAEKVAKPFEALLNEDAAMADRTGDLLLEARIAGVDPAREFAHLRKPEEIQGRMKAVRAFMRSAPNDPRMPIWMEELNDLKTAAKHEANRAREFPRLRQQFQVLSPKAQTVFRSVLKHQDRMTDLYFAALNRKIANLDLQGKQKAAIIARLRKDREGMRVQGPYVPLSRHGNFWVATQEPGTTEREAPLTLSPLENGRIVVKGRELHAQRELLKAMGGRYDGKAEGYVFKATIAARVRKHLADFLVPKDYEIPGQISFDKFETEAEQQEFIKAIEEEGGREVLGSGLNMPKPREMEQVAPDFVVEVDGLLAGLGDDPAVEAVRDALYQNYLERLPEMSSRKHWLHAKKTPGYSHDVLRNLATKTVHDANQIARIRHGGAAREALDEAAEALKVAGTKNSRKMADARLEALTDYLRDGYLLDDARFQSWVSGMGEARRVELEKIRKRYRSDAEAVGAALRRQARVVESAGKIVAGNEQHFAARVIAEMEKTYTDAMNPSIHPAALWLNSLGFGMHLAVSPGAALANALQTPIMSMPAVAAKFGVGATNKAFAKAYADFFRGARNAHGDLSIESSLSAEEARALYRIRRSGAIDKTLAHDTTELSNDPAALMSTRRSLRKIMAGMFHHAERMNREVSYVAAFRLGRAAGMEFDAAAQYAESILHQTHYDYTQWNRARLMRGNWARVITQFKQYSLGTTWLLGRNFLFTVREMLAAAKGEQSVRDAFRSEAYKTLAGILGMQLMFAGALGLPIGGIVMAINALGGAFGDDDDEPFDFEASFRVWAAETFGTEAGRALAKGVLPWAVGLLPGVPEVDLQSKLSMADLWFRDPDRELEGNDAALYWMSQLLGPSAGQFVNLFMVAKLWEQGHPERAAEKMLPKALADYLKAGRYHAEGVENLRGDKLVEDLGITEELAQALGLTPTRVSERYAENRAIGNADAALNKRRQGLLDRLAQARMAKDGAAYKAALAEAAEFSKKNPDRVIRGQDIERSIKSRQKRTAQTEAGLYLPKQRAGLRDQYRFAEE